MSDEATVYIYPPAFQDGPWKIVTPETVNQFALSRAEALTVAVQLAREAQLSGHIVVIRILRRDGEWESLHF